MNPELFKDVKKIITHERCADGTISAMILRDAIEGLPVEFIEYNTREQRELKAEPGLLFCDMSPPKDRVQEFIDAGAIVLDHHAKIKETVLEFGERGVFADENLEPGVSGATLAYREIWVPIHGDKPWSEWRELAFLAGVRDTWQTKDPQWEQACMLQACIAELPVTYWLDTGVDDYLPLHRVLKIGYHLRAKQARTIRKIVEHGMIKQTDENGNLWGITTVGKRLISDVAELARKSGVHNVVGFTQIIEDGERKTTYSLRSDGSVDVGEIAKNLGGGGHSRAAGFSVQGWLNGFDFVQSHTFPKKQTQ